MTQPMLAEAAGMSQPRISEIERPGERKLNLETLLRLASAFDVALQVRFVPFTEFIDDSDTVDYDNFDVAPFGRDMENLAAIEERNKQVLMFSPWIDEQLSGAGQAPPSGARLSASSGFANVLYPQSATANDTKVVSDAA